jgi:hypothetical protein
VVFMKELAVFWMVICFFKILRTVWSVSFTPCWSLLMFWKWPEYGSSLFLQLLLRRISMPVALRILLLPQPQLHFKTKLFKGVEKLKVIYSHMVYENTTYIFQIA